MQSGQPCDLYVKHATPQPSYNGSMLWPLPVSITTGSNNLTVAAGAAFTFTAVNPSTDLSAAFARISALIFTHDLPSDVASVASAAAARARAAAAGAGVAPAAAADPAAAALPTLSQLVVTVANVSVPLQLGVDESYTLTIPGDGSPATLTSATVYGAYYGLQTFSQLVFWNPDMKTYQVNAAPIVVKDAPRFAWRGILIDTDRHFLPLTTIFSIIDSVTYAKMNTVHWHIVDWQSWPLESAAYPLLWTAAWSYSERYTFEDVAAVVEYARARGVRIVPEFDTPGHAGSMCTGYPDICPSPTCTMPLNPASPNTLPTIQAVLSEIAALTPDTYFHLGGDEVDTSCWSNTPAVVAWMNAHGYTTAQTYGYFVSNVDSMALALNKLPVRWEEVWKTFRTTLDPRTIIHVWLSAATLIDVVNNGYNAIWSVDGQYYLDALNEPWTSFYDVDVLAGVTNVTAQQFVLGGEAEMWGETADPSEVQATIWPRAAAVAERLWSYDVTSTHDAPGVAERLAWFRCFMNARGVGAAPVNNAAARSAPPGPGSCLTQ
jgi:hexosaminidase